MNMRVLIVEDNAMNAELERDLFELHGHQVKVCTSGASLRSEVSDGTEADVILMDIMLPDADGVALVRELRLVDRFARIPILAVTAQAFAADMPRFMEAGFDGVITKPIDTRNFVEEVERKWRVSSSSTTSG